MPRSFQPASLTSASAASQTIPLYLVDAFASGPFSGNPAAVCLLESWPLDAWLQNVAAEMKHSETAFVVPEGNRFGLRWLTPEVEVDLCGHATLAAACVLWQRGFAADGASLEFSTRSGILSARRVGEQIELNFPLTPVHETAPPAGLCEALDAEPEYVGSNGFDFLLALGSEREVRVLKPDFRRLGEVPCRGVIVTAPADDRQYDFVSRFFGPSVGVDEDPVTGSAHCTLADYWQRRLGKSRFEAFQASARGGEVGIRIEGNRVRLLGSAVIVARGELLALPA